MPNLNQMNAPQYNIPNQPSFQTSSDPFIHKLGNQIDNLDLYRSVAMPRDAAQGSDPAGRERDWRGHERQGRAEGILQVPG